MKTRSILLVLLIIGIVAIALIAASLFLTPTNTNPAFDAALQAVEAAARGDDATALAHVGPALREYAAANCPDGSLSACVDAFTPPEWGDLQRAVYRRAAPDSALATAWDIDIISYYSTDTGASGVCIYARSEWFGEGEEGQWLVTALAGFVHCADPESRNMGRNPSAPNRIPPVEPAASATSADGVTITDRAVVAAPFRLRYPAGWRVITSPAATPLTITLVAPGDCDLVMVSVAEVEPPLLADCAGLAAPMRATVPISSNTAYALALGQEANLPALRAAFDAVITSLAA